MAETEKFSKDQIATIKHILKKVFAGYLSKGYMEMFNEDVYRLTEKGKSMARALVM